MVNKKCLIPIFAAFILVFCTGNKRNIETVNYIDPKENIYGLLDSFVNENRNYYS